MTTARLLLRRALPIPILGLAAIVATCRESTTTGPGRLARLSLNPLLPPAAELAAFDITADSLRVIVVRPIADTLVDQTLFFDPDSTSLRVTLSLTLLVSPESLDVSVELRGQGVALFSGTQRIEVAAGDNPTPPPLTLLFTGPGNNVDTLKLSPLDSVITLGDSLRYRVAAVDAAGAPITQFYVSWSTSDTTVARVNASGLVRAPNARAAAYVRAQTPNGRRDSTLVTFIPVPTAVAAVSGGGQSGAPGALLPQPLVAKVTALDGLGVKGIAVHFQATGGGLVSPADAVTDAGGFAQTTATLGTVPGSTTFQASVAGVASPTAFPATVVALAPTQLAFGVQPPATATAGVALNPAVTVELRDAQNQIVTTATNPVTIALGANPGGANLSGTFTVNAVNGVATFSDLSLDKVAPGYTLVASSGALPPVTSTSFSVAAGAAAQLAFTTQPGNIIAGAAFSPSVSVEIRDAFGNPVTSATNTVVLGLGANPGGAVLLGNPSVSAAAGVATFPGVSLDKAATAYTITASAGGLSGATSASFDVAPGLAAQLAVTAHPASAVAGQAFTQPVVVEAQDQFGNLAPSFSGLVSVALGTNPGNGTLGGSTSANAVAGMASFTGLSIDNPGTGYTLVASGGGLTAGSSGPFDVTPPTAGRFWIAAAGGNWSNPANWSGGIVPGPSDTVFITLGGTYTVTLDVNDTVAFLFLGGGSGTQALTASNRTVGVDSAASIAPNASLTLVNTNLTGATASIVNQGSVTLQSTTVAPSLTNVGTLVARSSTALNGALTTGIGSTFRVEGDPFCCTAAVTVAGGFANNGLLELTAINGSGTTSQLTVTGGPLVNGSTGTIDVLPGTGGARNLSAELDNQGTVTVDQPLTLSQASAAHTNGGAIAVNQNVTISQSGTAPSFTTSGDVVIGSGATLSVSNGAFDYASGALGGLGTVSFSGVTVGLGQSLTNDTLTLTFTNGAVNGPGTLGNSSGRTLVIQNTTVNAPVDNQGVLRARSSTTFNGAMTTGAASTFRVEGDPFCCTANVAVTGALTNNGLLELTAINGGGTTSQLTVSGGPLVNASTGTIAALLGTGGARTLTAAVDNQGAFTVDQPLTLNGGSADHLNSGTLTVNQDLTLAQSGTSPSFTTSGTVVIATGRTLGVSGGAFDVTGGSFGGLGTLSISGTTVGLGQSLTNDTLTLSFTNSTVNGPGTLGNTSGRTLSLQNTTVNAPVDNQGLLRARSSTTFNGAVTTGPASTFRVEGDPFCCTANVAVTGGLTNNGLLELTAINGGGTTSQLTVSGGALVNAPSGTIHVLPGTGGARTITGAVDNQGTITVDQALTWNGGTSAQLNSGTLAVNQNLTLNQSGSFATSGTVVVAAGMSLSVSGGAFDYTAGGLGGLGTVSFTSVAVGLGQSLTNDTLTLTFTNGAVNGPGTLINAVGRTLFAQNVAINAPLTNLGVLQARSSTSINGSLTTAAGSTFRVEADPFCCTASVTVANGFTNNGALVLTAVNGSGTTAQLTVSTGTLVNVGAIFSLPGTGGARNLFAQLDNQGTLTVDQPLTLSQASAAHTNSGAIQVNQNLIINQSGTTPSFTTSGSIQVTAGQALQVNNGAFDYTNPLPGGLAGLGIVNFSSVTLGLTPSLTNDTLTLTFTNGTVNGPGTLGNSSGRTLVIQNTTVNAPVDNQGVLRARSSTTFNGAMTTGTASTFRVEGDPFCCTANVAVTGGLTNNGLLELTAINGGGTTSQLTVSGGVLVNAPSGTIHVLPGTGGARTLTATLDNQGTVTVDQPLTLNGASAAHTNSGAIAVNQNLTISQSGTTPSFTTSGSVVVAAGQTLQVNSGAFDYTNPVPGGLAGFGTLSFSSVTVGLTPSLTNDTLTLTFTNGTVNGPGTLGNASGRTLVIQNAIVNAPVDNQGLLRARSSTTFNGPVTTAAASTFRVEADPFCCTANVTVTSGLVNNGLLELTAINGTGTTSQLTVSGGALVNAPSGTIHVLPGTGGARTLTATLDNQGTVTVDQPLTVNGASAAHVNSGSLTVNQNLTVSQSGTTPSFANDGIVEIGAGRTATVTGGTFTNNATGTLRGNGTLNVVAATFSNAGGINPGTSPGTLTVTGALPLAATSVLNIELGGTGAGQFDQIAVSGAVTQNGTLNVTLVGGFAPALNDLFTVVTTGAGLAGAFTQTILPPGMTATVVGNDLVLNQATSAVGTTITWAGATSGSWSSAANWNPALVPSGTDTVVINAPGTYTVTLDVDAAVAKLLLGTPLGGTQTLTGAGRLLTLGAGSTISPGGALTLTGGSTLDGVSVLTNQGTLTLTGSTAGIPIDNQRLLSLSTATLNGQLTTAAVAADTVRIGQNAPGTVTIAKGFTNNGTLFFRTSGTNQASTLVVTQGVLVNAPGALFRLDNTGGATRTFTGALDNQGTVQVAIATTFNGASAAHTNSGTIDLTPGGNLTVLQSGTSPSFTNSGAVIVPAPRVLTFTGGTYSQTATGSLSGGGTANFTTLTAADFATTLGLSRVTIDGTPVTLNASQSLGGRWSITNTTLSGPATWTVAPNDTLDLTAGTIGIDLVNQGLTRAVGVADINGSFSTIAGSTLRLGQIPGAGIGGGTITFANALTNNSALELQSVSGSTLTLALTTGTLVNAPGATLLSDPSGAGIRRITAPIDNQGTLTVNQSVTLNPTSAVHTSAGTIDIATGQALTVANAGTLSLSGTGKAQGAGTLDVSGDLTAPAGTAVTVGTLRIGGVLSVGGGFSAGTTVFTGIGQTIPVLPYGNVTVNRSAAFSGTTSIGGSLLVSGSGAAATVGGFQVTVAGDFSTAASGVLNMTNANGVLTVNGNATFGGGGTSTVLTAGRMFVGGNFTQTLGANSAFSPSGTHRVVLDGTGAQTVTFASPGTGAALSHFQSLEILNTVGTVTLGSNVFADGTFQSTPVTGTPKVVGGGFLVTAAGLNVTALTLDRALLKFSTTSTALPTFNNVSFVNFQANDLQFNVEHPGNVSLLAFSNLTFTFFATGTGTGYYLRVNDNSTLQPQVLVSISHDPGNGQNRTLLAGSPLPQVTWLP